MGVKLRLRKGRRPGESAKYYLIIHHNRKRRAKCVGTDKRIAEQTRKKVEAQLAVGALGIADEERAGHPFAAYYTRWLETYVRAHCKPSTYAEYESAYRIHLLPHFGERDITDITRDDVKALVYAMLEKGRARATVRAVLAPFREMYAHAIEDGHATTNPATGVLRRTRGEAADRRAADFLTREELATLLDVVRRDEPAWYAFVLTLARTGMRLGEAVALQWDDIDWHSGFVEVRRSYSKRRHSTPKSGKGRRVDLSNQLLEVLAARLVDFKKAALRTGVPVPAWVFPGDDADTPLDANNFRRRQWRRCVSRAKLRAIHPHVLRHTFASLLIAHGEPLPYVRDQLGHHSIQITVDTYGHLVPGGNRAAVNRLDEPAARPSEARSADATRQP
jgi:integrase